MLQAPDCNTFSVPLMLTDEVAATIFAEVYGRRFKTSPKAIQEVVEEMIGVLLDSDSDEEHKQAALDTIAECLFPQPHHGELGMDLKESEETDAAHSESTRHEIERLDFEERTFAERLRRIMREKKITQAQLAEATGVGQPAISNMLNRACRPQRKTVEKLARGLGVPSEELWPAV